MDKRIIGYLGLCGLAAIAAAACNSGSFVTSTDGTDAPDSSLGSDAGTVNGKEAGTGNDGGDTSKCTCAGKACGFDSCGNACGTTCSADEVCVDGACLTGGCPDGQHDCSGVCSDLITDVANCGFCGTRCQTDPHGTSVCAAAECGIKCADGYLNCGGKCSPCPADATAVGCFSTACVATACPASSRACGGTCASCDPHATRTSCGADACVADACADGYPRCQGGTPGAFCKCKDADVGTATGAFSGAANADCRTAALFLVCGDGDAGAITRFTAAQTGRYGFSVAPAAKSSPPLAIEVIGDCGSAAVIGRCATVFNGYGQEVSLTAGQSVRTWVHSDNSNSPPTLPMPYAFSIRGPLHDQASQVVLSNNFVVTSVNVAPQTSKVFTFTTTASRFAGTVNLVAQLQLLGDLSGSFKLEHGGVSAEVGGASGVSVRLAHAFDEFKWVEASGPWTLTVTNHATNSTLFLNGELSVSMNGPAW